MPKRLIKKYFPDHKTIKEHKHLQVFGSLLHNQNLWHLNRRSFAGAIAVGLFVAFIPLPTQMVIAAAAAIVLHVNLPVSVATVWVTNPVTMPPIFFSAYWIGAWILDTPMDTDGFLFTFESIMESLSNNWQPFLLGCFIMGCLCSTIGYALARGFWRFIIVKKWRLKKTRNTAQR
ncbi:MAG: ATP-binding protein [Cycloclasticus sp. symbiont of Poecilosclerida sp. M]|nr:MAG: ATP-binding protein [Cycloclasticus sp. symbiont of Poecilosclerida sp. M]